MKMLGSTVVVKATSPFTPVAYEPPAICRNDPSDEEIKFEPEA
jgi:hypothetical protein